MQLAQALEKDQGRSQKWLPGCLSARVLPSSFKLIGVRVW